MRLRLRWALTLTLGILVLGGAFALYRALMDSIILRVAIERSATDDATLLGEIAHELTAANARFRIKLVTVETSAEAMAHLQAREVDFAIGRADSTLPAGIQAAAQLYKQVAVLGVESKSPITSWSQLSGKTLAVINGTAPDDPLIEALLRLHGATQVKRVPVDLAQLTEEILKKRVAGAAFVAALSGRTLEDMHALKMRKQSRITSKIIEVSDSEALATQDKRYEEATIPPGVLAGKPPLPEESVATLSVSRLLLTRQEKPRPLLIPFLRKLVSLRSSLLTRTPLAGQIGAPNLEKDALIPAHAAAKVVFGDEDYSLFDTLSNLLYVIPALLGLLGSAVVGLIHFLSPPRPRPETNLALRLQTLRRDIQKADAANLPALEARFEEMMDEMLAHNALSTLEEPERSAVLFAARMVERQLTERRMARSLNVESPPEPILSPPTTGRNDQPAER